MIYSRHPTATADDAAVFYARDARLHPDICDDIEPRPTARDIEAQRREVREIEESLAEIEAEIGVAALRRDVRLGRLQAMADAAERDLGFAKRALAELLERTEQ